MGLSSLSAGPFLTAVSSWSIIGSLTTDSKTLLLLGVPGRFSRMPRLFRRFSVAPYVVISVAVCLWGRGVPCGSSQREAPSHSLEGHFIRYTVALRLLGTREANNPNRRPRSLFGACMGAEVDGQAGEGEKSIKKAVKPCAKDPSGTEMGDRMRETD